MNKLWKKLTELKSGIFVVVIYFEKREYISVYFNMQAFP